MEPCLDTYKISGCGNLNVYLERLSELHKADEDCPIIIILL